MSSSDRPPTGPLNAWLDKLVSGDAVDFLKWDFNRAFTEAGWPSQDDPERLWTDHVRAVYAIIDRLWEDHPHLRIGGGPRCGSASTWRWPACWAWPAASRSGRTRSWPRRPGSWRPTRRSARSRSTAWNSAA